MLCILGKRQLAVQGIDIGLFQVVHFVDELPEKDLEPWVIQPMQAGIGYRLKSTINFVG